MTLLDYVTDGFGRRIAKKVGGAITQRWLYGSAITPIAEVSATGVVAARYVYGTRNHVPDFMVKGGVTYRVLTDHVGSVRLVVNTATGVIAQRIDYDAFGRITQNTSPGFQPFAFAGGLYDADTGLVRLGARDYDPSIGRWTAKDPTGFRGGDANLYAYSYNDPVNLVDFDGLKPGDVYASRDAAAQAAIADVLPKSVVEGREYAGWITRQQGGFSYTAPVSGSVESASPGLFGGLFRRVGTYHTHGACTEGYDSDNFSEADKGFAWQYPFASDFGIYLGAPGGMVLRSMRAEGTKLLAKGASLCDKWICPKKWWP